MAKSIIQQVLTAIVLTSALPLSLSAQTCPDAKKLTAGLSGPITTIRYLADDALEGRLAGSPGERCAGDFIAARMKALGLKPAGENGTYFQTFEVASPDNPHAAPGRARNVVGILEGSDPLLKNEIVIVGAHYDHLGWGPANSLAPNEHAVHNGADDNASGTAAMLEVARLMAKDEKTSRSILFMAFSGEEEGIIGSTFYANNPVRPNAQARAMLNMDMVGRLGKGPLIVYGVGTAKEWRDVVTKEAAELKVPLTLIDDGYGASDHTAFYLKDIPVLHFFSNVHTDYHRPSDDWEKIDREGLQKVAEIVAEVAEKVADKKTLITLVKGAGNSRAGSSNASGLGAASLGTIPDYSPASFGVKISGVRDGSAAQAAGMKGGDIIIRFDDEEIKDLQAMTDGLRKRKPGDAVRVTVLREGKEVVLNAVLGRR